MSPSGGQGGLCLLRDNQKLIQLKPIIAMMGFLILYMVVWCEWLKPSTCKVLSQDTQVRILPQPLRCLRGRVVRRSSAKAKDRFFEMHMWREWLKPTVCKTVSRKRVVSSNLTMCSIINCKIILTFADFYDIYIKINHGRKEVY